MKVVCSRCRHFFLSFIFLLLLREKYKIYVDVPDDPILLPRAISMKIYNIGMKMGTRKSKLYI